MKQIPTDEQDIRIYTPGQREKVFVQEPLRETDEDEQLTLWMPSGSAGKST